MFTHPRVALATIHVAAAGMHRRVGGALVVTVEIITAHNFRVAVWVSEHENIDQVVHRTIFVRQWCISTLGVMVVNENDSLVAGE